MAGEPSSLNGFNGKSFRCSMKLGRRLHLGSHSHHQCPPIAPVSPGSNSAREIFGNAATPLAKVLLPEPASTSLGENALKGYLLSHDPVRGPQSPLELAIFFSLAVWWSWPPLRGFIDAIYAVTAIILGHSHYTCNH
jgi:hypothetical protein